MLDAIDLLRVVYTRTADDGKVYELAIRQSGLGAVSHRIPGGRDQLWAGDIWTETDEDVLLLELLRWLDDPRFTQLGARYGTGRTAAKLRSYTTTDECHEVELGADLTGAPELVAQIAARLRLFEQMGRDKRFTRRRINPKTATASGEIG